jgi:glutamate racemase
VPPIVQHGSADLAGVIEGDPAFKQSIAECVRRDVKAMAEIWKESKAIEPLQTIVLGCTHYPLAQHEIDAAFDALRKEKAADGSQPWGKVIAEQRRYVNPAQATARELFRELARAGLRLKQDERGLPDHPQFYLSVPRPESPGIRLTEAGALQRDYQYSRVPDRLEIEDTKNVPLTPALLPPGSAKLVSERLPAVWTELHRAR